MITMSQSFKKNTLITAVIVAMGMPVAHALEIKAEVSGTSGGVAFSTVTDTAISGSVGVSGNAANTYYNVYGSDAGNFGSRVSGNREYDITGVFSYADTISNATGVTQAYGLDFEIVPGEVSLSGSPFDGFGSPGGFLLAEYSIDILIDGTSIWGSSARVERDDNDDFAGFTYGGTSLGGTETNTDQFSSYNWSSFIDSIALGTLNDGESLNLEYILTTRAAGNIDGDSCLELGYKENFDGIKKEGDGFEGNCGSIARSGDPFDFGASMTPNTFNISSTVISAGSATSVPEPGSLALLGLGLAGAAVARRRRNKKQ